MDILVFIETFMETGKILGQENGAAGAKKRKRDDGKTQVQKKEE